MANKPNSTKMKPLFPILVLIGFMCLPSVGYPFSVAWLPVKQLDKFLSSHEEAIRNVPCKMADGVRESFVRFFAGHGRTIETILLEYNYKEKKVLVSNCKSMEIFDALQVLYDEVLADDDGRLRFMELYKEGPINFLASFDYEDTSQDEDTKEGHIIIHIYMLRYVTVGGNTYPNLTARHIFAGSMNPSEGKEQPERPIFELRFKGTGMIIGETIKNSTFRMLEEFAKELSE